MPFFVSFNGDIVVATNVVAINMNKLDQDAIVGALIDPKAFTQIVGNTL